MIKLPSLSINIILGIIIVAMGGLALVFALLSGSIHRDLVFDNQKSMMHEMIKITSAENIKDLNLVSQDLGLALQSTEDFNQSLTDKNELVDLLNNQFHQYFVTAGIIDLKQIILLDKNLSFITESSEGSVFYRSLELVGCSNILDEISSRKGLQRRKIYNDLCLSNSLPINITVVPVGGLKLKAYLMIITDPSHNLKSLEGQLGLPLKLELVSHKAIFKSSVWPEDETKALISSYPLTALSGGHVMSVLIAQNLSGLTLSLQQARIDVLLITVLVTLVFIGLSIFTLRKCMLLPLRKLSYKLRHFNSSQTDSPENIHLEGAQEMYELCEGFNYMASEQYKAKESDQQKSQFLANMSHEIRTPLTAIIGFSETLYKSEENEERKSYIDRIIKNGKHLHQLINDILDLSKIEANQLAVENISVSVCEVVMEINSMMSEKANSKQINFNIDVLYPVPKFITTDPTRLKQILINICSNAIKFTEKGDVRLEVKFNQSENNMIFSIKDSGIGMSPKQVSGLFKPFKQADSSTTRKYGGTGLGLYISKLLSEKLGGSIRVSSMINIGSLFELFIDAGDIDGGWVNYKEDFLLQNNSSSINTPNLKGKVLLAEDNLDNQELISLLVESTGAIIDVVENGSKAVEKSTSENYDLILMDMQMPEMGGVEAITMLRKNKCTTPVAVLTANAMKEDELMSSEAGANCFLTKPINQEAFYNVLSKYLRETESSIIGYTFNQEQNDRLKKLKDKYISRFSEIANNIKLMMENKAWGSLSAEIHKLKGTGSTFGFSDITVLCSEIEEKIKKLDYGLAEELTETLVELLVENAFFHNTNKNSN